MAGKLIGFDVDGIFAWYRQFSHENVDVRLLPDANALCKISEAEISEFKEKSNVLLPEIYLRFLQEIGAGRILKDATGRETDSFDNSFLAPNRILELASRKTAEWNIYNDFFGDDEVPFFDLGSASILVFAPKDGQDSTVWSPNKFEKIANSFEEFLLLLKEDTRFYTKY